MCGNCISKFKSFHEVRYIHLCIICLTLYSRKDVSASPTSAFAVAKAVLSVSDVTLNEKTAAAQLCLWLCSYSKDKGDTRSLMENMCCEVIKGIQAHVPRWTLETDKAVFGCRKRECERQEFNVSASRITALFC